MDRRGRPVAGRGPARILRGVEPAEQPARRCPRCDYDLRGARAPRCPECGLTFTAADWDTGLLREHVPSHVDVCDVWQPHAVLLGSLYELLRGVLRPRWVLRTLDLRGSLGRAGLTGLCGTVWLYVLAVALISVAGGLHGGASPAAALKAAALYWAPRVVLVAMLSALLSFGAVVQPVMAGVAALDGRAQLRLTAHWAPGAALYVVGLVGVLLLLVPAFATEVSPHIWPVLAVVPLVRGAGRDLARRPGRASWVWRLASALLWVGLVFWTPRIWPGSLVPPAWIYE